MAFQSSHEFAQVDRLIPLSEGLNINTCIHLFNQQTGGGRGNSLEASACPIPPSVPQPLPVPSGFLRPTDVFEESQDLLIT